MVTERQFSRTHSQLSVGSNDSKRPASSKSVIGLAKGDLITGHLSVQEELEHVAYQVLKLKSKDAEIRRKSADALAIYIADQRCLPEQLQPHPGQILAEVLAEKEDRVVPKPIILSCARSLAVMGKHAAPHAAAALAQYTKHIDEEVRWEVMRTLGAMGPQAAKDSAEQLAMVLREDESPVVKWEAAKTLRRMGGAAVVAKIALTAALKDSDPDIHNECARAIGGLKELAGPEAATHLCQALLKGPFELRRKAAKSLGQLGPEVASVAAHSLGQVYAPTTFHEGAGSDETLRRLCVEALTSMGPEAIIGSARQLASAVGDPDDEVSALAQGALRRANCVRALGGTMALFEPHPDDVTELNAPLSPVQKRSTTKAQQRLDIDAAATVVSDSSSPQRRRGRVPSDVSEGSEGSVASGIDLLTTAPKHSGGRKEAEALAARLAVRKAARAATQAYARMLFVRYVALDMRAPRTYRRFLYERIARYLVPVELRQLQPGDVVRFADVTDFQLCIDSEGSAGPVQRVAFSKRRDGMRQVIIVSAPRGCDYVEVQSAQGEAWLKGWVRAFGDQGESLLEKVPHGEIWKPPHRKRR